MYSIRCKFCGSNKISKQEAQQSGYSYKKGFLGTLVFGAIGAVAGIGGKNKAVKIYTCEACGKSGEEKNVIMPFSLQVAIDDAIMNNNVEQLRIFKKDYRNIEWSTSSANSNTLRNVAPIDEDLIITSSGILKKYTGKKNRVIIPNSVTAIGEDAFRMCTCIESIVIPNSVTSIGNGAFCGCKNLESIELPDSVTFIGRQAFEDCNSLKKMTIPNGVPTIDEHAFNGCKSLISITIPNSVTSIGALAFNGCKSLESIIIPAKVNSIGKDAFYCPSLKNLTVEIGNPYYYSEGNCLIETKTKTVIKGCNSSVIPQDILSIGDSAFNGCESLREIKIPDRVTTIGELAFGWCKILTNIIIPSSVTSIGMCAFNGCDNLKSVVFENANGWICNDKNFNESELSNPATVAIYINGDYWQTWQRKEI